MSKTLINSKPSSQVSYKQGSIKTTTQKTEWHKYSLEIAFLIILIIAAIVSIPLILNSYGII